MFKKCPDSQFSEQELEEHTAGHELRQQAPSDLTETAFSVNGNRSRG